MTWFSMNVPVAAAFFTAWTAIPLWLVLKHPDTATGPQVSAVPSAPAGPADGPADTVPVGEPRRWRAVSRPASRLQNQLTSTAKPAAAWRRPARRGTRWAAPRPSGTGCTSSWQSFAPTAQRC